MPTVQSPSPVINQKSENPKVLRWAGGGLFVLGLVATFLAFTQRDVSDKVGMVLNAAVLLSLGYPILLYVQALQKIAALEQRLRDLEQRPET
jgi:hypothetical protein